MYLGEVPVIFCRILMKLEIFRQIFEKYSNIKFSENPSGRRRVLCGPTDMKLKDAPKSIIGTDLPTQGDHRNCIFLLFFFFLTRWLFLYSFDVFFRITAKECNPARLH